ncbi:LytTR family DNA-binding domain-containing protein [uncultured Roseibium sp.]|uniref:LytR/AlgR family response regulator transcription factor n=1 Tax=uncultured Roseibium sp. TaxID=1936171 RepID=UPI002632A68D|nr:LytTR family DNA-binding domain-containing protein [uncultured Roseibium sp.]
MHRVILVDDEPSARRGLRRMLGQYDDIEIVAEAGDIAAAQGLISRLEPDAVFLDVELSGETGFKLAPTLPPRTAVIIVSAHDNYAISAFDIAAIDFLVKPVAPQRLETTIERLRERMHSLNGRPAASVDPTANGTGDRIHLKTSSSSMMVAAHTISMLQAEGDYTRIFLQSDQSHLVSRLLRKFEPELPSPPFHRLGRSLIVNKDHIDKVEWGTTSGSCLHFVSCSETVDLGRTGTRRLRELLKI